MKFVTFLNQSGEQRAGVLLHDQILDLEDVTTGKLPSSLLAFIENQDEYMPVLRATLDRYENMPSLEGLQGVHSLHETKLCAPLPNPPSIRDFYAFEAHVKTARRRRGLDVVPEWYEIPVFYFTNHRAVTGPGESIIRPRKSEWLDYELELACIIGKTGRNIQLDEAEEYIFGYCIMNDWSARDLQMKEMKVGLGPAKGKDFATSLGPYIVTKDELEAYRVKDRYDLDMTAKVNDQLLSRGNFKDIYYSFAEMIQRASEDVTLYPGDVIGSGTVGTGCILELGTEIHCWLQPGDVVELEITGLGKLINTIKESQEK